MLASKTNDIVFSVLSEFQKKLTTKKNDNLRYPGGIWDCNEIPAKIKLQEENVMDCGGFWDKCIFSTADQSNSHQLPFVSDTVEDLHCQRKEVNKTSQGKRILNNTLLLKTEQINLNKPHIVEYISPTSECEGEILEKKPETRKSINKQAEFQKTLNEVWQKSNKKNVETSSLSSTNVNKCKNATESVELSKTRILFLKQIHSGLDDLGASQELCQKNKNETCDVKWKQIQDVPSFRGNGINQNSNLILNKKKTMLNKNLVFRRKTPVQISTENKTQKFRLFSSKHISRDTAEQRNRNETANNFQNPELHHFISNNCQVYEQLSWTKREEISEKWPNYSLDYSFSVADSYKKNNALSIQKRLMKPNIQDITRATENSFPSKMLEVRKKDIIVKERECDAVLSFSDRVSEHVRIKVCSTNNDVIMDEMIKSADLFEVKKILPISSNLIPEPDKPDKVVQHSANVVKVLLNFIFFCSSEITEWDVALETYSASKLYNLKKLQTQCEGFFEKNAITTENVNEIAQLAAYFKIENVIKLCEKFKNEHSNFISKVHHSSLEKLPMACSISVNTEPLEFCIPLNSINQCSIESAFSADFKNEIIFEAILGSYYITGFQIKLKSISSRKSDNMNELHILCDVNNESEDILLKEARDKQLVPLIIFNFRKRVLVGPQQRVTIDVTIDDLTRGQCCCCEQNMLKLESDKEQFMITLNSNQKDGFKRNLFFIEKLFYTIQK